MSGTYRETFTVTEQREVEIEVDGAYHEREAILITEMYADIASTEGAHTYSEGDGRIRVRVTANVQDSELESNEDGEWEADEDDENGIDEYLGEGA